MKPELVCKIIVRTANGARRVSGYPIAQDRIITVAHDVIDAVPAKVSAAKDDARDITLFFGAKGQ